MDNEWTKELDQLKAEKKALMEALRAYQKANRIHNDSEAVLFEEGADAIAKAERKEPYLKGGGEK